MNFNETEETVILGSCGWRDAESGATPSSIQLPAFGSRIFISK